VENSLPFIGELGEAQRGQGKKKREKHNSGDSASGQPLTSRRVKGRVSGGG